MTRWRWAAMTTTRDFSGRNLRHRSFRGFDLQGADFSHSDLQDCDFQDARLAGASFESAQIGCSHREASSPTQIILFIIASGLLLIFIVLGFAIIATAYMALMAAVWALLAPDGWLLSISILLAILIVIFLFGALIRWAIQLFKKHNRNIKKQDDFTFLNADLTGAVFRNANISNIDFSNSAVTSIDLENATISKVIFTKTNLTRANLRGAKFQQSNFARANLTKIDATGTDFSESNLTGAIIQDWKIDASTEFDNVQCDYVYLSSNRSPETRQPPQGIFRPGEFAAWVLGAD